MKKSERKAPDSDLEILSCVRAAEICHVDKDEIINACEIYRQTGGRDGLACFTRGKRTQIPAWALMEWQRRLVKKEVA